MGEGAEGELTYNLELNWLQRRRASNAIRYYCDLGRLDYELHEYPSLFSSVYLFRVKGNESELAGARALVGKLVSDFGLRRAGGGGQALTRTP